MLHRHVRYAFGLGFPHKLLGATIHSLSWYRLVRAWCLVLAAGLVFNPDRFIIVNLEFLLNGLCLPSQLRLVNGLWLLRWPPLCKLALRPMPELGSGMARRVQGQQLLTVLRQEWLPPDVKRGICVLAWMLLPRYLVGLLPGTTVHDFLK